MNQWNLVKNWLEYASNQWRRPQTSQIVPFCWLMWLSRSSQHLCNLGTGIDIDCVHTVIDNLYQMHHYNYPDTNMNTWPIPSSCMVIMVYVVKDRQYSMHIRCPSHGDGVWDWLSTSKATNLNASNTENTLTVQDSFQKQDWSGRGPHTIYSAH